MPVSCLARTPSELHDAEDLSPTRPRGVAFAVAFPGFDLSNGARRRADASLRDRHEGDARDRGGHTDRGELQRATRLHGPARARRDAPHRGRPELHAEGRADRRHRQGRPGGRRDGPVLQERQDQHDPRARHAAREGRALGLRRGRYARDPSGEEQGRARSGQASVERRRARQGRRGGARGRRALRARRATRIAS